MPNTFMAVVERSHDKHTAYCPEIPEVKIESRTKIEALAALRVALIQTLDERRGRAVDNATPNTIFETITVG